MAAATICDTLSGEPPSAPSSEFCQLSMTTGSGPLWVGANSHTRDQISHCLGGFES